MKNLFHAGVKEEITGRIQALRNTDQPLWGKMNVAQMLAHCLRPLTLVMGETVMPRPGLLMRLMGGMIKKSLISPKPYKQGLPTSPSFLTHHTEFDFDEAKQQLLDALDRFMGKQNTVADFHHPLFGKMTKDEWGISQYKHLDHHLQQFGK